MDAKRTISELEAELKAAQAAARVEEREREAVARARWKEIMDVPANVEWRVTATTSMRDRFGHMHDDVIAGARIERRVRPEVVAMWLTEAAGEMGYVPWAATNDMNWAGMFYYRTDEGILTHEGGGTLVLNDPMLCSDDEWAKIMAGDIPQKYRRRAVAGRAEARPSSEK